MGVEFDYRVYRHATGQEAIIRAFMADVANSAYKSGHCYSGAIGTMGSHIDKWDDKEFGTEKEALEYLSNTHVKWAPATAVSYLHDGKKRWVVGGWCSS